VQRFDWLLLLDPVAPAEPACWQPLSATTVQGLQQGQRLLSPGLEVRSISPDSQALLLQAGRQRWGLLPDRQALWSWRRLPLPPVDRLWWGFKPSRAERQSAERG
jgi:competence protein ComEC